ncbi:unnamed protein product [Closterium sp. Naga37s-1]|nr:unnamed protein product [Closterium sp. Naga37s-1]
MNHKVMCPCATQAETPFLFPNSLSPALFSLSHSRSSLSPPFPLSPHSPPTLAPCASWLLSHDDVILGIPSGITGAALEQHCPSHTGPGMSNVAPPSPTFPPFPPPAADGGVGDAGVVSGVPLEAPPGDGEEGWAEGAEGEAEGGAAGEAEGGAEGEEEAGAEGEEEAGAEAGAKGAEDAGAEAEGSAPRVVVPRVVVVGLESGRSNVNPWSKGLLDLKMPAVRPGDFLLFRWFGQMRDVQQFPNKQAFDSCDFSRADPAGGADVITVVSAREGAEEEEDESLQRLRALRQVVWGGGKEGMVENGEGWWVVVGGAGGGGDGGGGGDSIVW